MRNMPDKMVENQLLIRLFRFTYEGGFLCVPILGTT